MKLLKTPLFKYIPFLVIALILIKVINQTDILLHGVESIISILTPIFAGIAIAFLLDPAVLFFNRKFKFHRYVGILTVFLIIILIFSLVLGFMIPLLYESFIQLKNQFPSYMDKIESMSFNLPIIGEIKIIDYIFTFLDKVASLLTNSFNNLFSTAFNAIGNTTKATINFFIAVIVSIYLLVDFNNFKKGVKQLIYALTQKENAEKYIDFIKKSNDIFSKYILGKLLLSSIVAIFCSVGFLILNIPYAILLGIIIGVTNLIPYIGPFIGSIPALAIGLSQSPLKCLIVLIIIIIAQQIDNTIIGPKLLSDKVGISPFEVLVSIIVGGALFGLVGLIFSVPAFAVFKMIYNVSIDNKLKDKNIKKEDV